MKNLISAVLAIFAFCAISLSQTPAPSPSPTPAPASNSACSSTAIQAGTAESNCAVHFVTGSAFYQLSNGKQATEFDARVPLTPRWSGFAAVYAVPTAQGNITVAGPEFREKLGHLLKSKSTQSTLNLNKIQVFGRFGLGSEINSQNNNRSLAYLAEGGISFPVATVAGGPVVQAGVRIGFLGVVHPGAVPEKFYLGSNTAISPQVSVSF